MSIKDKIIDYIAKEIARRPVRIPIVLEEGGKIPSKETEGAAAYDLFASQDIKMENGRFLVPLNIRFSLPQGYVAIIKPRSGLTLKGFLVVDNYGNQRRIDADVRDGVIDSDYRGIVGVMMYSNSFGFNIKKGTGIAQLLIVKVENVLWEEVSSLDKTKRGEQGFAS